MPTARLETAEETTQRWRSSPDADNPAGPLYAAGTFAEADIAAPEMVFTAGAYCTEAGPCSVCTISRGIDCC